MATRRPYTKQDEDSFTTWLAHNHPEKENRCGNAVWKRLAEDQNTEPWSSRHGWQSWRQHYLDDIAHFDKIIAKKHQEIQGTGNMNVNEATRSAAPTSTIAPPERANPNAARTKQKGPKFSVPKPPPRPANPAVPNSLESASSAQVMSPSPQQLQDARDVQQLAKYFMENGIPEKKCTAAVFQDMRHGGDAPWARVRSAMDWWQLYQTHKEEVFRLAPERNSAARAPSANATAGRGKKRRRDERDQPAVAGSTTETNHNRSEGTNGAKKRRLNGTPAPSASEPQESTEPITNEVEQPTKMSVLKSKEPIIYVTETPPCPSALSRETTPVPKAKPSRVSNGNMNLGPTIAPSNILRTVEFALNKRGTEGIGQYGILGSPLGPVTSTPVISGASDRRGDEQSPQSPKLSMNNGLPRINGNVPAMHIFPRSLPSLTPALRERTISREAFFTPPQGDAPGAGTTPDARNGHTGPIKQNSIFAQVGQETPRNDAAGNARRSIFPHALPHLTPALRLGPHGENEYIINEDSVVFTSQQHTDDLGGETLFPASVPNLTPALRPGPRGEINYVIRGGDIQFLEKGDDDGMHTLTGYQNAVDDDEFEGPSPMPYLGSDRHSSRSFSFSHGQDEILEGLVKALSNHPPNGETGDTPQDKHGEAEEEEEEEAIQLAGKRSVVPPKRTRLASESPLFASSDDDGADADKKSNGNGAQKVQRGGMNYPVLTKVKARGVVRVRGQKRNVGHPLKGKRDSESDGAGGSDKENEVAGGTQVEVTHQDQPSAPTNGHRVEKVAAARAPTAMPDAMDETPDARSSPKSLHFSGKTPPSPDATAVSIKPQVLPNLAPPATAPATSKAAGAIILRYGESSQDIGGRLKAALSYPSPNIPSELEEALKKVEEPSPLQRLAKKAMLAKGGNTTMDDGNISDAGKPRHGKVRFDGVALDRDRRKTTGGIGTAFGGFAGGSKGLVSKAAGGPSLSRFKAAPALFGSQRRPRGSDGAAFHDVHFDGKDVEILDLDDEEEQDESPLARYSQHSRATSSPHKFQTVLAKSEINRRSSNQGLPRKSAAGSQSGRSVAARPSPPPPSAQVPIVTSPSPLPGSSHPMRRAARKGDTAGTSTQNLASAKWPPFQFSQASRSHAELLSQVFSSGGRGFIIDPEQGMSIGFRDQEMDAEWVSNIRGRPSITSTKINPRRRSAPIPEDGDMVVYASSSRSPSRARSGSRRSTNGRGDMSGLDALSIISDVDKQRIRVWLADNRNPDLPSQKDEEEEEAEKLFEGLGLMFESMAANNGFVSSVPRNVWKQCGDLSETAIVVQAMTEAANMTGLEALENRQRLLAQDAMDVRESLLAGEVDGRRKSGRWSIGDGGGNAVSSSSPMEPEDVDENEAIRKGKGRPTSGTRSSRPRPPSHIPAEVIEPLISEK